MMVPARTDRRTDFTKRCSAALRFFYNADRIRREREDAEIEAETRLINKLLIEAGGKDCDSWIMPSHYHFMFTRSNRTIEILTWGECKRRGYESPEYISVKLYDTPRNPDEQEITDLSDDTLQSMGLWDEFEKLYHHQLFTIDGSPAETVPAAIERWIT